MIQSSPRYNEEKEKGFVVRHHPLMESESMKLRMEKSQALAKISPIKPKGLTIQTTMTEVVMEGTKEHATGLGSDSNQISPVKMHHLAKPSDNPSDNTTSPDSIRKCRSPKGFSSGRLRSN